MSSQDFSGALDAVGTQLQGVAESYASEYVSAYNQLSTLVATISKYPEYLTTPDEDIVSDADWTDVLSEASDIVNAAGESPVMQEVFNQIEKEFGISVTSPLSLAQNIMQGKDSGLLKVIVAMLQYPIKMSAFTQAVQALYDATSSLALFIDGRGASMNGFFNASSPIPDDVLIALQNTRNKLQTTLMSPFDVRKYELYTEELRDVIVSLESVPIIDGALDAAGSLIVKMVMDASSNEMLEAYRLLSKAATEAKNNISVIKTTDTAVKTSNTQRFVMAKKAIRRINGVIDEMKRGGVLQGAMIPKYIIALNVAHAILRTGKPVVDSATVGPMDVSGVIDSIAQIDLVLASCRKIILCLQKPARLFYLKDELASLYGRIQLLNSQIATSSAAITALAEDAAFEHAFEVAQSVLALIQGLDYANMLLSNGDYSSFFEITETTATSEAAAQQALTILADLCEKTGMPILFSSKLREAAKKMEKQEREKRARREAKKERKKSKIVTAIEETNKLIQDGQELFATAIGAVDSIQSIIN